MKKFLEKIRSLLKALKEALVPPKVEVAIPVAPKPVESIVEAPSPVSVAVPEPIRVDKEVEPVKVPHAVYYDYDKLFAPYKHRIEVLGEDKRIVMDQYRAMLDALPPPPGSAGGLGEVPPVNLNKN